MAGLATYGNAKNPTRASTHRLGAPSRAIENASEISGLAMCRRTVVCVTLKLLTPLYFFASHLSLGPSQRSRTWRKLH